MTRSAGCPGLLAVIQVAGEATDPFVDSEPRAIVARAHLHCAHRCVALVAERLARVGAHLDWAGSVEHRGHRKLCDWDVLLGASVKPGKRWASDFLRGARDPAIRAGPLQRRTFPVRLMASQTRHGRLVGQLRTRQTPWTVAIHGRDQVPDAAFEVHPMAGQEYT